jgi:hypothetical protein
MEADNMNTITPDTLYSLVARRVREELRELDWEYSKGSMQVEEYVREVKVLSFMLTQAQV